MKTNSPILVLLTGIAVSTAAVATASADEDRHDMRRGEGPRMERMFQEADSNDDGVVSFEEFAAHGSGRFIEADLDGNGEITVDELADVIEREQYRRRAARMIERFDLDNDGVVSVAEIEDRQQKMFALADRDNSGSIEEGELPRFRGMRGGFRHGRN